MLFRHFGCEVRFGQKDGYLYRYGTPPRVTICELAQLPYIS